MNIPRDPGKTWAYNIGVGFGYKKETLTFGTDFIYQQPHEKSKGRPTLTGGLARNDAADGGKGDVRG